MAPNLASKPTFVRGEHDLKPQPLDSREVRTEYVLQNIFAHLLRQEYNFHAVSAINSKEVIVIEEFSGVVDDFKRSYSTTVSDLCSELQVSKENVSAVMLGISNELFCEGITWGRIVAFFVFVGELALLCLVQLPEDIIDVIYENFYKNVKENLEMWVDDHGGWEGVRILAIEPSDEPDHVEAASSSVQKEPSSSWAKSVFHSTVKMFGTLAHIANAAGQNMSFP